MNTRSLGTYGQRRRYRRLLRKLARARGATRARIWRAFRRYAERTAWWREAGR